MARRLHSTAILYLATVGLCQKTNNICGKFGNFCGKFGNTIVMNGSAMRVTVSQKKMVSPSSLPSNLLQRWQDGNACLFLLLYSIV